MSSHEAINRFDDTSVESDVDLSCAPIDSQEAIKKFLRGDSGKAREAVVNTLGGVFENLNWPSYEEWLKREKDQRRSQE